MQEDFLLSICLFYFIYSGKTEENQVRKWWGRKWEDSSFQLPGRPLTVVALHVWRRSHIWRCWPKRETTHCGKCCYLLSLVTYNRHICTVFCFARSICSLKIGWLLRMSSALEVVAIGVLGLSIQTFSASHDWIQRTRAYHLMEELWKVHPVPNRKPSECRGSKCGRIKLKWRKLRTFCLQYFQLMLLNMNSLQALYVLPLDNKKKITHTLTFSLYYSCGNRTRPLGNIFMVKKTGLSEG